MRAACSLLGTEQKQPVAMSGVSQPTIQRMEASETDVLAVVHTLTKAIESAGINSVRDNAKSRRTDAKSASGTRRDYQAITPSDQNRKLPDGDRRTPDDPSTQAV